MFDSGLLTRILFSLPAIIIGFSLHEFAHAYAADRLGDPTPRSQGRLSISPATHIDPIGLLLIAIAGFGWAKPVQVNRQHFKNPKRDDIIVSAAGPLTNLGIAIVFVVITKLLYFFKIVNDSPTSNIIIGLCISVVSINVLLFLFNLLPIPPLDGFHVLSNLIPPRFYKQINFLYQYGTIILILFIITPASDYLITGPRESIVKALFSIVGLKLQ